MIDSIALKQTADKSEIDIFTILREYLQIHFLDKFYKNNLLKKTYFKGGTAIRLIFGSSRFSEDLDFTTSHDRRTLRKIIETTVKILEDEFPDISTREVKTLQGYSSKLIFPTDFSKQALTVRLDFSMRENVLEPQVSPIETGLPIIPLALVEHLSKREILAEKVRALLTRKKGRDLFDFWYLLSKNVKLDTSLIKEKFKIHKSEYSLEKLKKAIGSWDEKDIDQDLRKFLPVSQRRITSELKRLCLGKLKF